MFFNHIPELLGLLVLGLLIFGPKRMIEMGGQLGKLLRDLRGALKEMDWGLGEEKINPFSSTQSTLGKLSQLAQSLTATQQTPSAPAAPADSARVVEATAPTATQPTAQAATQAAAQASSEAPVE